MNINERRKCKKLYNIHQVKRYMYSYTHINTDTAPLKYLQVFNLRLPQKKKMESQEEKIWNKMGKKCLLQKNVKKNKAFVLLNLISIFMSCSLRFTSFLHHPHHHPRIDESICTVYIHTHFCEIYPLTHIKGKR